MPVLRYDDAPEFEINGVPVKGLAAPSRGATETMTYRVVLRPGHPPPTHAHDHEEVFHVISGRMVVSLDGEETALGAGVTRSSCRRA
jgi:quercetin dioxygenase-like cupin family protein